MHGQVVRKLESNAKVNSKVEVEVRVELGNENSTEETLLHSSSKYEIKYIPIKLLDTHSNLLSQPIIV